MQLSTERIRSVSFIINDLWNQWLIKSNLAFHVVVKRSFKVMPLISASDLDVNREIIDANQTIGLLKEQSDRANALSLRAQTLKAGVDARLSMPTVTNTTRSIGKQLYQSLRRINTTLMDATENIDEYQKKSEQALASLEHIQRELGKGKLFRTNRESGSSLVAEAKKICLDLKSLRATAEQSRLIGGRYTAATLSTVEKMLNEVQESLSGGASSSR